MILNLFHWEKKKKRRWIGGRHHLKWRNGEVNRKHGQGSKSVDLRKETFWSKGPTHTEGRKDNKIKNENKRCLPFFSISYKKCRLPLKTPNSLSTDVPFFSLFFFAFFFLWPLPPSPPFSPTGTAMDFYPVNEKYIILNEFEFH